MNTGEKFKTLKLSEIEKRRYLPNCFSDKSLKGMAVNQTRNSFNGGACENTSTVPWSYPPVPFSGHDMPANLDMLIRRTSRHPLPVEIIRNIVNQVSVTGFYTL